MFIKVCASVYTPRAQVIQEEKSFTLRLKQTRSQLSLITKMKISKVIHGKMHHAPEWKVATSEQKNKTKNKQKKTSQDSWGCLDMLQVTENDGYHVHLSDAKCRSADWLAWSSETKLWHPEINKENPLKAWKCLLFWTKQTWKSLIGSSARTKMWDVLLNPAIKVWSGTACISHLDPARKHTDAILEKGNERHRKSRWGITPTNQT